MSNWDWRSAIFLLNTIPVAAILGSIYSAAAPIRRTLVTNLDQTFCRLAGMHASVTLWDMVHLHALLTQEADMPSFFDPSLSFLGDVNIKKVFVIGGGVMFSRFICRRQRDNVKPSGQNAYVDPSLPDSTGHYTFAGTKLMARASFDPKPFFKSFADRFLGPNDLRIYSEAAILGLKDYPGLL